MDIQQTFPFRFYDDLLQVYVLEGPKYFIGLRELCQTLGLSSSTQRRKIEEHPAMKDYLVSLSIPTPYQGGSRIQEALCLDLEALPYWLGSLNAMRVGEQNRAKVILYQREVVRALWAVFRSDILPKDMLAEGDQHLPPFEQQYHHLMDEAAELRRSAAELRSSSAEMQQRLEGLDQAVGEVRQQVVMQGGEVEDVRQRLGVIEARVLRGLPVNSQQALHLKDMVAALADALTASTGRTRSRAFSEVYQEFYHTFDIPIYTELPQTEYANAVRWFTNRYRQVAPGQALPSVFARGRQESF